MPRSHWPIPILRCPIGTYRTVGYERGLENPARILVDVAHTFYVHIHINFKKLNFLKHFIKLIYFSFLLLLVFGYSEWIRMRQNEKYDPDQLKWRNNIQYFCYWNVCLASFLSDFDTFWISFITGWWTGVSWNIKIILFGCLYKNMNLGKVTFWKLLLFIAASRVQESY